MLNKLSTPAVIVDINIAEANIKNMADGIKAAGIKHRPHIKTHKSVYFAKKQLEAAGASMSDVVKVSVFLADIKYFNAFNSVYKEFFMEPYPVRTTIGCQLTGILVEVDIIAET